MEILYRGAENPRRVAVFPGAFNPPTIAHLAIARAALGWADETIWVLPRSFPHKPFEGASFEERCEMLDLMARSEKGFSAAVSEGGLYAEIAAETRLVYGAAPEIGLLCGRDAAERIAGWDYGVPGFFDELLVRHPLLVASRDGHYEAAERHRERVVQLATGDAAGAISSSEVRRRMERGDAWEQLVPPAIRTIAQRVYIG